MAQYENLTDAQLVAELEQFGETVKPPIHHKKRPLYLKKLNHYRARMKAKTRTRTPNASPKHDLKQSRTPTNLKIPNNRYLPPPSSSLKSTPKAPRSLRQEPRPGSHSLEPPSPGDDDADIVHSLFPNAHAVSNSTNFNFGISDAPKISNAPSYVLMGRTQDIDTPEQNHENKASNDRVNVGSDREIPEPPARPRLYPKLNKFSTFSSTLDIQPGKVDSSESDMEVSSYTADTSYDTYPNSVSNTYEPARRREPKQGHGYVSSSSASTYTDTSTSTQTLPHTNLPHAPPTAQSVKPAYVERLLPSFSLAKAGLLCAALLVAYIAINIDYLESWFSLPDYMGSGDILLLCADDYSEDCYEKEEIDIALDVIKGLFTQLSVRKGEVICNSIKSEASLKATVLRTQIFSKYGTQSVERIYNCTLDHILVNPHWNIKVLQDNGYEAVKKSDIYFLESSVASMTLWCRLVRSLNQVLYGIFVVITVIGMIFLLSIYIQYKLRRRESEQKEVYNMVEKIIDMLQDHHEQIKNEDLDEPPYLAVSHVRDQLLPPSQRRQLQPIWDKAVSFIAANESRIRLEPRLIGGEEYEVWTWLQPSVNNGKIWQGQVFGEKSENNSNQVIYSPTPCLKIRNMFDTNMESGENWQSSVTDAILEKCKNIKHIVHIYVDVDSREGCVYLKCSSCEAAGKARLALHGWWFDGRLVTVKHLKLDHYHKRWPEAKNAIIPLKPSTDQMKSLAQPYYRSSLEMT